MITYRNNLDSLVHIMMFNFASFTTVYRHDEDFVLSKGIYLYGNLEERSAHFDFLLYQHVQFLLIEESEDGHSFRVENADFQSKTMANFHFELAKIPSEHIYLDITGLSHSIWAPLIKAFLESKINFSIVYVEPMEYNKLKGHGQSKIYDLSEKIRGIAPIPGFATFAAEEEDAFLFVPMLGFEGARFSFMIETVDPAGKNTYPIIGVPGFRAEYPFYTYQNNQLALKKTNSWRNVLYVTADCPFSAFHEIKMLSAKYPKLHLKIALIGTKPHALGGVLFRLAFPERSELLYDHPIKKQKRTRGFFKKHIFDVQAFLGSLDNPVLNTTTLKLR